MAWHVTTNLGLTLLHEVIWCKISMEDVNGSFTLCGAAWQCNKRTVAYWRGPQSVETTSETCWDIFAPNANHICLQFFTFALHLASDASIKPHLAEVVSDMRVAQRWSNAGVQIPPFSFHQPNLTITQSLLPMGLEKQPRFGRFFMADVVVWA